ncbi:MAG TPA: hypothetical protein VJT31_35180 [Rugosimonospora sp.]|nr:hypothetical protein [Rugosimonospora sp.]
MTHSDTQVEGRVEVVDAPVARPRPRVGWAGLRLLWWAVLAAGCCGLFLGYLRMSRTQATNSDGASNALQAWDMLHGNLLLHGWTLSDVSFYTTELPQYALVELVYGLRADVIHVAAAMTYTLLVLAAAVLARGRARGVAGLVRAGIAVAILLVPEAGTGYLTLLNSPDHTGTGLPVLVTWIVLERGLTGRDGTPRDRPARWLPYAVVPLLAWGAMGDTLVIVTAVLPLIVVSALRLAGPGRPPLRDVSGWLRRTEGRLLVAGVGGLLLAEAGLLAVRLGGGFSLHAVSVELAGPGRLGRNAWIGIVGLGIDFGAFPPDAHGTGTALLVAAHLVGVVAVLVAAALVAVRTIRAAVRGRGGHGLDWVAPLLAFGILANLAAFVLSTLPADRLSARQIVSLLPLGAALAGRVYGPRLTASLRAARRAVPVLVALLLALGTALGVQAASAQPVPAANQDIALWLRANGLRYGLGGYWSADVITLVTGGEVTVVPLSAAAGTEHLLYAYRWESRSDWFDPTRHDARFLVLDLQDPAYGRLDLALAQFGEPRYRQDFGRFAVLVYDVNLLVGLPALCGGGRTAPSMAECPRR